MHKFGNILHPILLGIFLAYLMEPMTSWFQTRYQAHVPFLKKRPRLLRAAAVLSCFLFFLSILCLGGALLSWNLVHYFKELSWENFIAKMTEAFAPVSHFFRSFFSRNDKMARYGSMFLSMAEGKLGSMIRNMMESTLTIPVMIGRFFLGLFIAIYLLIDKESFLSWMKKNGSRIFSAKWRRRIICVFTEFQKVFSGYLKGQALDALFMGVLLSVGLALIRVPLGISIGILAGIGNLVPYLGPVIAYVLTTFFCLLEGRFQTLFIAFLYLLIVQQIDGSLIGPKLLGDQIRLRPIFVVIAVLTGGTFFGPLGMVLAVPFAGLIKALYQLREERQIYEK